MAAGAVPLAAPTDTQGVVDLIAIIGAAGTVYRGTTGCEITNEGWSSAVTALSAAAVSVVPDSVHGVAGERYTEEEDVVCVLDEV